MKIAVLGTGMVGQSIASKLVSRGHFVTMGARSADNGAAADWVARSKDLSGGASQGTFAQAAKDAELVFHCAKGEVALDVLSAAGAENLAGKVLVDVSNPLDFSRGMPPGLSILNHDSLGETIQRTFPAAKVVKTLNTMNCDIMVDPSLVPGDHSVFVSGNDAAAKATATELLVGDFGWAPGNVIDLGDITTARGTEMFLPLWLRIWSVRAEGRFNIHVNYVPGHKA